MTDATTPAVSLREINADTVRAITRLEVAPSQLQFVAPNAVSLAQALFSPEAWYRAIYADEEPAGFLMLYDETLRPEVPADPKAYLWRYMVDHRFQGRGIGRAALALLIEHVKAKGRHRLLELSYVPNEGNPSPFYAKLGFRDTGRMDEGERVMELPLPPNLT